jgi:glutaredoxin-like protein
MMQELSGLHPMISLRVHFMEDRPAEAETYGIERVPAIVLRGMDGFRLRFYGIPAGTEFPSFLETIGDVSRREVLLSQESLEKLGGIANEVSVKVFTTPTCPYCPAVARIVCQIGMVQPMVRPEVIEVAEFPELAERYAVKAVPLTVIADRKSIPGMVPEETLVEEIVKAAEALAAEGEAAGKRIERGKERPSGLIIP